MSDSNRRRKKWLIPALVLVVVSLAVFLWPLRTSDWRFVRSATGFDFPRGTQYLAQHDNYEWYVVSVIRLPEGSIPAFVRQYGFSPGEHRPIDTAGSLPPRYRDIPVRSDVLSAAGQKEYQAWQAVLDPQSRLLWIHVGYPDFAGDHPGTAPQPKHPKA